MDDSIKGKITVLVQPSDPNLDALLRSLTAVLTDQYSYTPWWQVFVLLPLTLLLWAYSLFAFRRFTTGALSLAAPGLAILLSLFSITVQVQRGVWLETGDAIVYSLCISVTLLLQSIYRNWQIRARMEADDARLELAQLGRYELIRLLGKGAMGAVYLANDPTIRRQVAIKTPSRR